MKRTTRLLLPSIVAVCCWGFFPASFAASYTTNAISDAFVATGPAGNLRSNNYGGGGALAVAAPGLTNGEFQSVIKFDLSGARNSFDTQFGVGQWSLQSVSLQLSSSPHNNAIYNDIFPGLFGVSLMQNNSWVEGAGNASNPSAVGITYDTLQNTFVNNATDQALGTFNFGGGSSGISNYTLTLSSGLSSNIFGGNTVTLHLFAADTNVSYLFSSRSQPALNQPQLLITVVPEPSTWTLFALALGIFFWHYRSATRIEKLRGNCGPQQTAHLSRSLW